MRGSGLLQRLGLQGLGVRIGLVLCTGAFGSAFGQIPVGLTGTPPITFSSPTSPPPAEWATASNGLAPFDSGTFTTPAGVEAGVQVFDHSAFVTQLPTTSNDGTSRYARFNTRGYLVTQPAGVAAAVLKATLRNVSGANIERMTVSYDFGLPGSSTWNVEEVPGHRTFFSLTGHSNTWQAIPAFSGVTNAGRVSADLILGEWLDNTDMYLLWADDNAVTNPEGTNTIDNFEITDIVFAEVIPIVITNPPQSVTVAERASATFTVVAGGKPRSYYWFSNNVAVPGNNQASFTVSSAAYPGNDGTQIYVVLSNATSFVASPGHADRERRSHATRGHERGGPVDAEFHPAGVFRAGRRQQHPAGELYVV